MVNFAYSVRDFRLAPLISAAKVLLFVHMRKVHFGSFSFNPFEGKQKETKKEQTR